MGDVLNAREALTLVYEQVLQRSVGEVALPAPPRLLDRLRPRDCAALPGDASFRRFHAAERIWV